MSVSFPNFLIWIFSFFVSIIPVLLKLAPSPSGLSFVDFVLERSFAWLVLRLCRNQAPTVPLDVAENLLQDKWKCIEFIWFSATVFTSAYCVFQWVMLLFSCKVVSDSFTAPWTVAHQAPLSMRFPSTRSKAVTNLDSILKSRDITLPTKAHTVKAMVFPVVMYGCESWTIKEAEHRRMDAFKLWCWRRFLRVPWTARRSNQSILKEINPEYSLEGLMLKLKL